MLHCLPNLVGVELTREGEEGILHWIPMRALTTAERDGVRFDSLELCPLRPGKYSVRMMLADETDSTSSPATFKWPSVFRPVFTGSSAFEMHRATTCSLKKY